MPVGVLNARSLAELGGNRSQRAFRDARDVDLHMECARRAKFGGHAARQDVEILETLQHARQRTRIRVSDHPQTQERQFLATHKTYSSYSQRIEAILFPPALQRGPGR